MKKKPKDLPLRTGVGIVVLNKNNQVFLAKRIDNPKNFWQMPQGGVDNGEEKEININTKYPEFLDWKWVNIDDLTNEIVNFKVHVYKLIQKELYKII